MYQKRIFCYDLRSDSILLDEIHLNRPDKFTLTPLLGQDFNQSDYSTCTSVLAVDFMSTIRKISPGSMGNVNTPRCMGQNWIYCWCQWHSYCARKLSGWISLDSLFLPNKPTFALPQMYTVTCGCKKMPVHRFGASCT